MEQIDSPVPSYYISDVQFSRLYALAYLDEMLRTKYGDAYIGFARERLHQVQRMHEGEIIADLAGLLGGDKGLAAFKKSVPDAGMYFERYVKHLRHVNPDQSFKDALEENQLWAATNSVVYILVTQEFDRMRKAAKPGGAVFRNSLFDEQHKAAAAQKVILNMLFINTVRIDPVPSVLDGYDFKLLDDIIHKSDSGAIALPSNATCC